MGPRKRAKPNPADATSLSSSATDTTMKNATPSRTSSKVASSAASTKTAGSTTPSVSQADDAADGTSARSSTHTSQEVTAGLSYVGSPSKAALALTDRKVRQTGSWYGSWPRKSTASTSVARESILGGTQRPNATADFSRFDTTKKSADAMSIDNVSTTPKHPQDVPEAENPGKSEETNAAGVPKEEASHPVETSRPTTQPEVADLNTTTGQPADVPTEDTKSSTPSAAPVPETKELVQRPGTSAAWLNWFGKSQPEQKSGANPDVDMGSAPEADPPKQVEPEIEVPEVPQAPAAETPARVPPKQTDQPPTGSSGGGFWFGLWSNNPETPTPLAENRAEAAGPEAPSQLIQDTEDVVMQDAPEAAPASAAPGAPAPAPSEQPPKAGSTWAFWSRDTGTKPETGKSASDAEQGQLAVIGESSESHPKRANSIEVKDTPLKEPPLKSARKEDPKAVSTPVKGDASKKSKRNRPQSMDLDEPLSPALPATPKAEPSVKVETPSKASSSKTPTTAKPEPPNLLLPSFKSTYRMKENPSILRQIAQLLTRTKQSPAKHVFLSKDQPKIKKAIAIGVHGLFPASYIRTMIGQPTGTSIKFANHCAEAIRRWADSHGCEDCEIEKIALEGEGKIGERVENLWRLLLNWIEHLRQADLIILACHSQGVPVTLMLLAKLIELGIITSARIGVCSMAGVSLGPFPDYRSSVGMLMGSAAELWEFSNPESEVSKRLEASVQVVLSYGARITYVGSIDDQLVPLESAVYSPAHHPNIYRAAFIDGRVHAPDFIAHLVGFALKLRNLGVSDHGLIRELSLPLAGSLYSGEGHSRLYGDDQVYDLAVEHAIETTSVGNMPCEIHKHESLAQSNPYHLPWIMRGLLEEDFVKTELSSETSELLEKFDEWKPVNKALKDVKYRLEAVRSKL